MENITIYHNPRCSKSRQTLDIIRQHGHEPEIILYLENTPSAKELSDLLALLGKDPADILRKSEADYKTHIAPNDEINGDALLEVMIRYPKLIERPIVTKGDRAVIGRPPENVLTLL
ncbi:MAG: arsenate reductase (glutaredoxin) [Candidatus Puniceispirillaceae bacterium]